MNSFESEERKSDHSYVKNLTSASLGSQFPHVGGFALPTTVRVTWTINRLSHYQPCGFDQCFRNEDPGARSLYPQVLTRSRNSSESCKVPSPWNAKRSLHYCDKTYLFCRNLIKISCIGLPSLHFFEQDSELFELFDFMYFLHEWLMGYIDYERNSTWYTTTRPEVLATAKNSVSFTPSSASPMCVSEDGLKKEKEREAIYSICHSIVWRAVNRI